VAILLTPPKQQVVVADDMVRIQYWEKWTGEEGRQMKIIVDDFNNSIGKEKKIFVEYVSMSSIDQKTLVATAAGVPPDIAGVWDAQVLQFAAMDALEPLDELAREHGITPATYKPVFWKACNYNGTLWALISTPASIVLHYNKEAIEDSQERLRAAGFASGQMPQTIDELDRFAECLTTFDPEDKTKIKRSGHLPLEPGWYLAEFPYWFGGSVFNEETQEVVINTPENQRAFDWIASYSRKYGTKAFDQFRAGLGNFASAQNGFLMGTVASEQQGPWMANYIEAYRPEMNRWRVPAEKLARERKYDLLTIGMPEAEVNSLLGDPVKTDGSVITWDAGLKWITCRFDANRTLAEKRTDWLPAVARREMTQWGVVPFPNAVSKDKVVAFCPFDALVIPKGSKHKREAFEFIAYVNRQDVMEKLCALHCKNSPLAHVSQNFIDNHPNPYIQVFDDAANADGAFALPRVPIWPEIAEELNNVGQQCYLLVRPASVALKNAAGRLEKRWSYFNEIQKARAAK
jgi:ABC-type glycerol-3-phosphate transport system substrate-binding protein